jgi:hypothetical protein
LDVLNQLDIGKCDGVCNYKEFDQAQARQSNKKHNVDKNHVDVQVAAGGQLGVDEHDGLSWTWITGPMQCV